MASRKEKSKRCFNDSGVKTWKLTSNFPNRKSFWHVKGVNKSSEKMPGYRYEGFRNRFYVTKLNMAELATNIYLVNCTP